MTSPTMPSDTALRRVIVKLAGLSETELTLVNEFVDSLQQPEASGRPRPTVAEVKAEAERLATQMKHLSRDEVVTQYGDTLERMRAQAIAQGTAIDADWEGD